jgi:YegS/Rv2252/BmrU family lipid kinase
MRAVIVNPASASGRTEGRWRRIVAALEAGGEPLDVQLTTGPGDAIACTRRALEAGAHRIVVLGGDGTLGEVVAGCIRPDGTGMVRDDVELAIIHQGTGGDLARGLDVPKVEDAAIDVALNGAVRRIDVGVAEFTTRAGVAPHADPQLDGSWLRGFVSTANVGMAAEVVQKVTGRLKRLGNNGSFAVATVGCLARNKPRPITLSTREGLAAQLTIVDLDVCNNRFMGGGMLVAPDSSIDDGMFDVIVIAGAGRARLIRTFPKIYSGRHVDDPLVRVERTAELTVSVPEGADAEGVVLDGELVGSTPATFRVIASALSVRVPLGASSAAVDR